MQAGREFHSITAGCILWGLYHTGDSRFRPRGVSTRGELQEASNEWFTAHPTETKVRRELADVRGRRTVLFGEVYDFNDPYWWVRYPDGDWEELNRHEIKQRKELATASA